MAESSDKRYRDLLDHFFAGSARLRLLESADQIVNHVCRIIVGSGMFRGAVLLVADDKFRIRDAGFDAATADAVEFLRTRVRVLEGRALRPFDFVRADSELGAAQLIPGKVDAHECPIGEWAEADQLALPMPGQDGAIAGFLTTIAVRAGARPVSDDVRLLEVLLQHCSLQLHATQARDRLMARTEDVEQRLYERMAEARLAQEKFSRLINTSRDVILITDERDLVIYLNQAFSDVLGFARENFLGRPLPSVLRELALDRGAIDEALRNLEVPGNDAIMTQVELKTAGAARRAFEFTRLPVRQGGTPRGDQYLLRDVTHERALFQHLLTSERLAATGRLAAGVAHEINNPLQAILSQLNSLQKLVDPAQAGEQVERIREAISRIRQVLRGMLELNRGGEVARTSVALNSVIENVLLLLRPQLNEAGITANTDLQPELPTIIAAAAELQQLLLNLVLNAIEAMPGGGALRIVSRASETAVEVLISDDGAGMAPDVIPHIFEPFFTRKSTGTGLGLYISKGIADSYKAQIQVESALGSGSTFTVSFPLA
ncbi:PAS domain S-box protein [candidate division KSB1 bacterium]|nr:PAS domain S-box protein [candidate division KSB1 bacterium]